MWLATLASKGNCFAGSWAAVREVSASVGEYSSRDTLVDSVGRSKLSTQVALFHTDLLATAATRGASDYAQRTRVSSWLGRLLLRPAISDGTALLAILTAYATRPAFGISCALARRVAAWARRAGSNTTRRTRIHRRWVGDRPSRRARQPGSTARAAAIAPAAWSGAQDSVLPLSDPPS